MGLFFMESIMWNKLNIWWHKREARYWTRRIEELFATYDCGEDLLDMITGGRLSRYRVNRAWHLAVLKRIDPAYPETKQ